MSYSNLRVVFVLGALVSLGGCVTNYAVPPGAPAAKLRIVSKPWGGRQIWFYENERCNTGVRGSMGYVGGIGGGEASKLNMLDPQPKSARIIERSIPAGSAMSFSVIDVNGVNTTGVRPDAPIGYLIPQCTVTTRFTPKADAQYEAIYEDDNGVCAVTLKELVRQADGSVARRDEPSVVPTERICGIDGAWGRTRPE